MTLAHGNSFEVEIGEVDSEGNIGSNGCLGNIDSFQAVVYISFNDKAKDATLMSALPDAGKIRVYQTILATHLADEESGELRDPGYEMRVKDKNLS